MNPCLFVVRLNAGSLEEHYDAIYNFYHLLTTHFLLAAFLILGFHMQVITYLVFRLMLLNAAIVFIRATEVSLFLYLQMYVTYEDIAYDF